MTLSYRAYQPIGRIRRIESLGVTAAHIDGSAQMVVLRTPMLGHRRQTLLRFQEGSLCEWSDYCRYHYRR